LTAQRKVWTGEHWQFTLAPKAVMRVQHINKNFSGSKILYPERLLAA
jgi:hypothetical protein